VSICPDVFDPPSKRCTAVLTPITLEAKPAAARDEHDCDDGCDDMFVHACTFSVSWRFQIGCAIG
jgi:hypothetical protein